MKKNIAIKITAFLLSAMSAITLISGCGKKNDIADDFRDQERQGTVALFKISI